MLWYKKLNYILIIAIYSLVMISLFLVDIMYQTSDSYINPAGLIIGFFSRSFHFRIISLTI